MLYLAIIPSTTSVFLISTKKGQLNCDFLLIHIALHCEPLLSTWLCRGTLLHSLCFTFCFTADGHASPVSTTTRPPEPSPISISYHHPSTHHYHCPPPPPVLNHHTGTHPRGGGGEWPAPPLGTWKKHYIFRISSVKLRDLHLWSLCFEAFCYVGVLRKPAAW